MERLSAKPFEEYREELRDLIEKCIKNHFRTPHAPTTPTPEKRMDELFWAISSRVISAVCKYPGRFKEINELLDAVIEHEWRQIEGKSGGLDKSLQKDIIRFLEIRLRISQIMTKTLIDHQLQEGESVETEGKLLDQPFDLDLALRLIAENPEKYKGVNALTDRIKSAKINLNYIASKDFDGPLSIKARISNRDLLEYLERLKGLRPLLEQVHSGWSDYKWNFVKTDNCIKLIQDYFKAKGLKLLRKP